MPSAIAISLDFDDKQVRHLFQAAPGAFQRRSKQLIESAAIDIQRTMIKNAPIAVTGDLRRSVRYSLDLGRLQAIVQPDVEYAERVEKGGGPVSLSAAPGTPLAKWARLKGLNPWAIRASIAKKGTKAHPYVKPTYAEMKPKVEADFEAGINDLIREANDGRI